LAFKALKKKDGKKTRHTEVVECEDANFAGTKQGTQCTLILTEGKSAKGYATHALAHLPGKRDYFGTFPLRGKPLNTMNADIIKIVNNRVILDLKEVLGLREGVDYTVDTNYSTLRYGKILIMADADEDGKHIVGLLMVLFHKLYPSLIAREFIMLLRTPIIRVSKNKDKISFLSAREYLDWLSLNPDHSKWRHKYLKGLASSKPEEITLDFMNPKYVQVVYDDSSDAYLNLAFNEKLSDSRKEWLTILKDYLYVETWDRLPISYFIDQELIGFVRDNLGRSIPRLMDGLKESMRKILWGMYTYKTWGSCGRYENGRARIGKSDIKTNNAGSIKVGTLASHVQESTAYKHGEQCLAQTIINMAFDFVGSNNIEYFYQDGLFGTRNDIGEDAGSPRYIFCRPSSILPYIYRFEDFPLMEFEVDEGEDQEPVSFYPIIPMILVNGSNGIGSAYSTTIPKFNPLDLTNWIKNRLNGMEHQLEPIPWYKGFTGTITGKEAKIKGDEEVEVEVENEKGETEIVSMTVGSGIRYKITGSYSYVGSDIHVTELPIGVSMNRYDSFLMSLIQKKKLYDKHTHCTSNDVHFKLMGYTGEVSHKALRLVKTISTSNMIVLDEKDIPKRYKKVTDILNDFYVKRLQVYAARKQYLIDEEMKIIPELQEKIRFITDVVDGNIIIFRRSKVDIVRQLEERKFEKDIFKSVSLEGCTEEDINKLKDKLQTHLDKHQMLMNLAPESIWYSELEEFEVAYKKMYKL